MRMRHCQKQRQGTNCPTFIWGKISRTRINKKTLMREKEKLEMEDEGSWHTLHGGWRCPRASSRAAQGPSTFMDSQCDQKASLVWMCYDNVCSSLSPVVKAIVSKKRKTRGCGDDSLVKSITDLAGTTGQSPAPTSWFITISNSSPRDPLPSSGLHSH